MTGGLRAFLEEVIDYAGLFPPAQLSLDRAFSSYVVYRGEPESWMLGRFIIPTSRLNELTPLLADVGRDHPVLAFSVLGRGGAGEAFRQDLQAIAAFEGRHAGRVVVDALEVRVSLQEATTPGTLSGLALSARDHGPHAVKPFFELPAVETWREAVSRIVAACPGPSGAGLKLRCGGLEAAAFPPPEQVAFVITACRDARVPLKFTAGLHHPVRHYNAGVNAKMHGFLNVFGAGVLAHRHGLGEEQVRSIIEDEDPSHFMFDDHGFRWKSLAASREEIRLARQAAVTSFGSCSFDEPRDDLRALHLL